MFEKSSDEALDQNSYLKSIALTVKVPWLDYNNMNKNFLIIVFWDVQSLSKNCHKLLLEIRSPMLSLRME